MTKLELLKNKVALITLGCDKNTVDAEKMLYILRAYGFEIVNDLEQANIIIVNTCAFIKSAQMESIDTILDAAQHKKSQLKKLIVTGCLSQRNYDELVKSMPEVDKFVRLKHNDEIVNIICELFDAPKNVKVLQKAPNRVTSTPSHYAFLKIADGCNNYCSYCTIPFIRGRYKSEKMEDLVLEAKALVKQGVRELILVAQDVTNYGQDLYGKRMLVPLIKKLSKISGLKWIRLHYCYPNLIDDDLLNEMEKNPKLCKYLDIPLQHINDEILKNMNRKDNSESIKALIQKIKNLKVFVSLRSTFIIGFPQETNEQLAELKQFLIDYPLLNVGFFKYSQEEFTKASYMKQVPEKTKNSRLKEIQQVQEQVYLAEQAKLILKEVDAVCEEKLENNTYIFRTEWNSPNVDTVVYIHSEIPANIGEFYRIKLTDRKGVDFVGEIIKKIK